MEGMGKALMARDGSDTSAYEMADLGLDERKVSVIFHFRFCFVLVRH